MTPRLYMDEDSMDRDLVVALRARGVDVVTALEAGMLERTDAEQLEYARAQGRVLYSFNVGDFYRLHAAYSREGKSHAGIILAQQRSYTAGEQKRRLLRLIASLSAEDLQNRVEFLSAWD